MELTRGMLIVQVLFMWFTNIIKILKMVKKKIVIKSYKQNYKNCKEFTILHLQNKFECGQLFVQNHLECKIRIL